MREAIKELVVRRVGTSLSWPTESLNHSEPAKSTKVSFEKGFLPAFCFDGERHPEGRRARGGLPVSSSPPPPPLTPPPSSSSSSSAECLMVIWRTAWLRLEVSLLPVAHVDRTCRPRTHQHDTRNDTRRGKG